MEYTLCISGCDDETIVFLILSKEQVAFLEDICQVSIAKSLYVCQPIMRLEKGWRMEDDGEED